MKSLLYTLLPFVFVGISVTLAGDPETYGSELTLEKTTPISEIIATPKAFEGKRVQVAGKVSGVCKKMGCWIEITDAKDAAIMFKVDDGVIVFPEESTGKAAVAEGVVMVRNLTREQALARAEHLAEEQGVAFDSTAITGPQTLVMLKGEGAVLR
jgi:hypothetical protein